MQRFTKKGKYSISGNLRKKWINLIDNLLMDGIFSNEDVEKVVGHQKMVYVPLSNIKQEVKVTKVLTNERYTSFEI